VAPRRFVAQITLPPASPRFGRPSFSPSCRLYEPEAGRPSSGLEPCASEPLRLPGGTAMAAISLRRLVHMMRVNDVSFVVDAHARLTCSWHLDSSEQED